MHRFPLAGLALLGACLVATDADAQGDPEAGRVKANTCLGCHGIPGYMNVYPSYHVPRVAGQAEQYIVAALQAYANGNREHPTMRAQAKSLTEQDMQDIAAFFASAGSARK